MKIIVAYDGSPAADAAIDSILSRPWPEGSQVRVVMVLETPILYSMANGIEVYPPISEKIRQSVRDKASRSVLAAVERLRRGRGLVPGYEIREGDVKTGLLDAIREWGSDLVVVGSHGKGALGRLFLGSVSHALVTHAPCNVEVIRSAAAA